MSQRRVTFNLATRALFYKKRAPHIGEIVRFEDYEDGAATGRASNTIFYGSGREESPSPPPPPPASAGPPTSVAPPTFAPMLAVMPMFVGCEPETSPCPPPPATPAPPPPLNLGGLRLNFELGQDLPPLKLKQHEYPLLEDEQAPSWNTSPISPAERKSWLDRRLEEAAERKNALARAYADFIGKVTPPNQRTPASVCWSLDGGGSRHMSPLNLTPRPTADEGHLTGVVEEIDDETEASLAAVCEKLKAEHL